MNAIVVNNLFKHFNTPKKSKKRRMPSNDQHGNLGIIKAVDDVSFEVKEGEIFGFLGPNGAGKTTTIRMLTGVLKPTGGTIEIFNTDVWKLPIPIKQITGNVPEMANVYMDLTGMQNLTFIGEIYGVPKKVRIKRAEELLKKFQIYDKRHLITKKYSKGMKQRLLLCMALMNNPEILFLDEPTSGLDVQSSRIILKLIREYNQQGMTIFLTTHDMEVANSLCNRIAIINHGKIISLDTPENLKKLTLEYKAIDCYFQEDINEREIEQLKNVKEIQKVRGGCHIIVEDIDDALYELINFFKINNIKVKQLCSHQPKLEDVFLKIIEQGDSN